MKITVQHIGRRFNRDWIFRRLDFSFLAGQRYAVLGPNGSGKSTFLKVLSGYLTPSEGEIWVEKEGRKLNIEDVALDFTVSAPYIELIEEFTLEEHIHFHFKFKSYLEGYDFEKVNEILGLQNSMHKTIRFFSSGMKQRVKLVLACFSQGEVLILDEPTSNLDQNGVAWFHHLLELTAGKRVVIIGSNQEEEYKSCEHFINLPDFHS